MTGNVLARDSMEMKLPGTWDLVMEDGKAMIYMRCPCCAAIIPLDKGYTVSGGELLPCVVHHCGFHEYVYLRGWGRTHGQIWAKARKRFIVELRKRLRRIESGLEPEWHLWPPPHMNSNSSGLNYCNFVRDDKRRDEDFIRISWYQGMPGNFYYHVVLAGTNIQTHLPKHVGPKALRFYDSISEGWMPRLRRRKSISIKGEPDER